MVLWWCGGVLVVMFLVFLCFCGGVVLFLWWCFCGGAFVARSVGEESF